MKDLIFFVFALLLFQYNSLFSSERDFNHFQMQSKKTNEIELKLNNKNSKLFHESALYRIDLNSDGLLDGLKVYKRDGLDYIGIFDEEGKRKALYPLTPKGVESRVYRVESKAISTDTHLNIVYYYEGHMKGKQFYASSRIYLITLKNKNFKNMIFQEGPSVFLEREKIKNKYSLRSYPVTLKDLNSDGIQEVIVQANKLNRVLMFESNSKKWKSL
jgi:hypothetical protein